MSVLIRNQKIYEKVFYDNEGHFEDIAKKQFEQIFDDFIVVYFNPFVLGEQGIRRQPDLAMIHRDYQMWVVVEVELEHHSLNHHVFPQMETLSTGAYDDMHAEYLAKKSPSIDLERVKGLITYEPPVVMTLVNSRGVLDKGWGILSSDLQVRLTYLEVYRSEADDSIFSLSGYIPRIKSELITGAKKHPMMNALVCSKPNSLPVPTSGTFRIFFDGRPIYWQVIMTADSAILMPKPSITLRKDRNYEIRRDDKGRLELKLL